MASAGVFLGGVSGIGAVKLFNFSAKRSSNEGGTSSGQSDGPNGAKKGDAPSDQPVAVPNKKEQGTEKLRPKCEENFLSFYKNHLGASIPLTIMYAYLAYIIVRIIIILIYVKVNVDKRRIDVVSWFGFEQDCGRCYKGKKCILE